LIEPIEAINIGTAEQPRILQLVASLTPEEVLKFTEFLKENQINFAWSSTNMPGLDPNLIMHHLSINTGVRLVKQKLKKMHPHFALLVKEELKKLLDVGFIRSIDYAEWISNIVPISKLDGHIRICIDFKDLNKACTKDDFPLPRIDTIVDLTAGHAMYSLMDGFSGYNQIKIKPEDQDKTAFTCPWEIYCWNVMPFGLNNVGATYQRAMTTIFHDMMHTFMEDYVNDFLAKSYTREEHIEILSKKIVRMEKFNVHLNPKKCVFGVISGKLLGYIVLAKGIEVDPGKVQAIMDMPPPQNISQLQSLQGRLQSIRRFIAQLADKSLPFMHLLHKNFPFKWEEKCEATFNQIK
jgi:hypothetical protein